MNKQSLKGSCASERKKEKAKGCCNYDEKIEILINNGKLQDMPTNLYEKNR